MNADDASDTDVWFQTEHNKRKIDQSLTGDGPCRV